MPSKHELPNLCAIPIGLICPSYSLARAIITAGLTGIIFVSHLNIHHVKTLRNIKNPSAITASGQLVGWASRIHIYNLSITAEEMK
jgi:hypothetical protein